MKTQTGESPENRGRKWSDLSMNWYVQNPRGKAEDPAESL
jgi:hypothetical protein